MYRKYVALLISFSLMGCSTPPSDASPTAAPMADAISTLDAGFDATAQRKLEKQFDSYLNPDNLREWMKHMSSKPHHVGSPWSKQNAEYIAAKFEEWGYETEIEQFDVLLPIPKVRLLEMVSPTRFTAELKEPVLEEDATSSVMEDRLPGYNAYSADGDVTAELVYVNYGIPADYEVLERQGIDVKGKIIIARYGGSWRGIKPKVAYEKGAIGCIIFSDPRDDGYMQGDVYPEGPYRMRNGIQRGSVVDMPMYPGDPLTPGYGAVDGAKRLDYKEAPTIMKIPVLPISYADAQPLLEAMEGPVAPANWRGALPITYHLGPGPSKVHLKLEFEWKLRTAYNPVGRMVGSQYPDEWVMRGNHHDGWVFGASDPISGMVSLMEEARAVGELAETGWRPKRTIIYAGWDAEEPGLLGSTEWVEHHKKELSEKMVAYINTDGTSRGFLGISGSHTLEKFVNEVREDVDDPLVDASLQERLRARMMVNGSKYADREDLPIGALGAGSDYTPFLHHAGIASLNMGMGGEAGGGSYHSVYDSFDHYTRFMDPTFEYGVTLAKSTGRVTLRLADTNVLPFRFTNFVDHVAQYAKQLKEFAVEVREKTINNNKLVDQNAYSLAAHPDKTYVLPKKLDSVPLFDFSPIDNALARLRTSANRYEVALTNNIKKGGRPSGDEAQNLNQILMKSERAMMREEGLPRRSWFKHMIYAPGFYTGYGVKTLPGIREGLEERKWDEVNLFMGEVAAALNRVADELDRATSLL